MAMNFQLNRMVLHFFYVLYINAICIRNGKGKRREEKKGKPLETTTINNAILKIDYIRFCPPCHLHILFSILFLCISADFQMIPK